MSDVLARLPEYGDAILLTLQLTFISALIGLVLAVPLALLALSRYRIIRWPIEFFSFLFRGTPLLVQIYIIYRGAPELDFVRNSWLWSYLREPFYCALLAFSLNTCAYTIVIFKGAFENTSRGEIEAGIALGMNRFTLFRRIIFPSGIRRALPIYNNEVIFMLHGSAQASTITLLDILGLSQNIAKQTFTTYTPYLIAAGLYMLITFILILIFRALERRYLSYLTPTSI